MSVALMLLTLLACQNRGEEIPTTTEVSLTAYGVPQSVTGYVDGEFIDGWEVTFDHWVTAFSNVTIGDSRSTGDTLYMVDWALVDAPIDLGTFSVGQGDYAIGVDAVVPSGAAEDLTEIDADIRATMVQERYNHYVVGSGEDGGETITFAWGLRNAAAYTDCENGETGTPGLTVTTEEVEEGTPHALQLDFHLDHLFFDWLETEAADMRFEIFAAWADPNTGEIPWDTLIEVNAGALVDRDDEPLEDEDGHDLSYSNQGLPLTDYLLYSVQSMVHLNGQGLCAFSDL